MYITHKPIYMSLFSYIQKWNYHIWFCCATQNCRFRCTCNGSWTLSPHPFLKLFLKEIPRQRLWHIPLLSKVIKIIIIIVIITLIYSIADSKPTYRETHTLQYINKTMMTKRTEYTIEALLA